MYGAFIGDIVGSKYEFHNIKTKDFPLFSQGCDYTDDSIMTVAVAKAIELAYGERREKGPDRGREFREILVEVMRDFGRRYPYPTGAYGGGFAAWLRREDPQPYGSFGNGSAMRVSPCGLAAVSMAEVIALSRASASVTHNHPEGIRGAQSVADTIYLAKRGLPKEQIGERIRKFYYNLDFTLDSIRATYRFEGSCQRTVPQSIVAFLESTNFEDAIRNIISIGGDSDTAGAITGSIAWTYYEAQTGIDPAMRAIRDQALGYLPQEFIDITEEFQEMCRQREDAYAETGHCIPILSEAERGQ